MDYANTLFAGFLGAMGWGLIVLVFNIVNAPVRMFAENRDKFREIYGQPSNIQAFVETRFLVRPKGSVDPESLAIVELKNKDVVSIKDIDLKMVVFKSTTNPMNVLAGTHGMQDLREAGTPCNEGHTQNFPLTFLSTLLLRSRSRISFTRAPN